MSPAILTLTPLAVKYIDMIITAAIHKGFQDIDGMTDEELEKAIKEKEVEAVEHDTWILERLAKAKEEGR